MNRVTLGSGWKSLMARCECKMCSESIFRESGDMNIRAKTLVLLFVDAKMFLLKVCKQLAISHQFNAQKSSARYFCAFTFLWGNRNVIPR